MKRPHPSRLVVALLLAACGPSPSLPADDSGLELIEPGVLNVVAASGGTQSYVKDGQVTGYVPEIAKEVAKRLGLSIEIQIIDNTAAAQQALIGDRYDLMANLTLVPYPALRDKLEFTQKLTYGRWMWMTLKTSPLRAEEELKRELVGASETSHLRYLDAQGFSPSHIKEYPNQTAAIQALVAQQIDAVLVGSNPGTAALERNPEVAIMQHVKNPWGGAIAIRQGATTLLDAVNTQIDAMYADCTIVRLYETYLPGNRQDGQVLVDHPESKRCWEGSLAAPETEKELTEKGLPLF